MNICKSEKEYIDQISKAAQMACKKYGYLPSVLIAQACLENGYGIPDYWDNPQIALLIKYNNMVGIKSSLLNSSWTDIGLSVWNGESLTKKTPEVYGGKPVTITDNFRKYDSTEQSFVDYLLFMTYASNDGAGGKPKYGKTVLNMRDPESLITAVNVRGYTTGKTYPSSVMKIVRKHNLTKYDDLSNVAPTGIVPPALKKSGDKVDIAINRKYITSNNSYSTNNPVAIVIHNTDNFDPTADAKSHAEWLASDTDTGMSWHYAVDDHSIYQCLPHNRGAYHVGKNYGTNNLYSKYGGRDNKNTIAIEMCVNKGYDYEKAFQNTVKLTRYLMKELNIPASRVFQHWHICSKDCPSQIRKRGDWDRFMKLISGADPVTEKWYRVRKSWKDEKSQIGAYSVLKNAKDNCPKGYAVYDWNGKEVYRVKETPADKFLASVKAVCELARKESWRYGDSRTTIPCIDKTISCDRMVARALWDLGFTDQRTGGEVCTTLPTWLTEHGWKATTNMDAIKAGAVVAVRKKDHSYIDHVFVVESYNPKTGYCNKYDCGDKARIDSSQPFKGVKLMEWSDKVFVGAWNVPDSFEDEEEPATPCIYDGVDYSAVYNYSYYKKKYEDLRKAFENDKDAYFKHFCTYGMKEGRKACSAFDVNKYRNRYEDLRKAFGDDLPKYYRHYCLYGKREKRNAT